MSASKGKANYDQLVLLLASVFLAWALGGLFVFWGTGGEATARGTFGDMFGAINALFSGCAFAGLIYTIRQQSEELSLQRTELQLTRDELSGQREQMASQATTLKLQQFESTFFQLLRMLGDIVEAMDLTGARDKMIRGRDCFRTFVSWHTEFYSDKAIVDDDTTPMPEKFKMVYARFYKKAEPEVGHYFRHLYHIIKFVDLSLIDDKRRYTSFVRAQLSANELRLLFYNCQSALGEDQFKPLVEKYGLLKHLPRDGFKPMHRLYSPSAYLSAQPSSEDLQSIGAVDALTYGPLVEERRTPAIEW